MSSSTIVLNGSPIIHDGIVKAKLLEQKSPTLLIITLWVFSSLFSATKIDFTSNITGVTITFNMQDVVLIAFAAWMLHRGLATRNVALIFPWVIVTLYGLYYNHYKSLSKMMKVLRSIKRATGLPWLALFITSVGLGYHTCMLCLLAMLNVTHCVGVQDTVLHSLSVLRVLLILRIIQASANLWYRRRLEKELYNPNSPGAC